MDQPSSARHLALSGSRSLSGPLFPRRESESAVSVGCGFSETRPAEQRVAAVPSIAADLRIWLAFARDRRDSDYSGAFGYKFTFVH